MADARNHVSAWAYHFKDYNPTTGAFSKSINNYTASDSSGVHQGVNDWRGSSNASVTHRNRDTAWFLGYLIPFEYYSYLSVNPTGSAYHDTGHPNIADYQADNLTPNIVRYEARGPYQPGALAHELEPVVYLGGRRRCHSRAEDLRAQAVRARGRP